MLDIKFIRENPELVEENLKRRGDKQYLEMLNELLDADKKWRDNIKKLQVLRKEKNEIAEKISNLKQKKSESAGKQIDDLLDRMKHVSKSVQSEEEQTNKLKEKIEWILLRLPNLLDVSVPVGADDSENKTTRTWGDKPKFNFKPKDHIDICEKLGLIELDKASKISQAREYYLKNELVILDFALLRYGLDFLIRKKFKIFTTPLMVRKRSVIGTGFMPIGEEDVYKIDGEDLYLIGTSEITLASLHMDDVLFSKNLPLLYAGFSPCFRTEAGSHGRDTKGIFRVHKFHKIEQFSFCKPEQSEKIHQELLKNSEEFWQSLEISYRIVNICTGDMGMVASKKYDIEAWLPGQDKYREVVSCSNCTDYQSRRMNIHFIEKEGQAPINMVHTLNSTLIATNRAMIAILENFQQEDGSVKIPKVLQKYTGFKKISTS